MVRWPNITALVLICGAVVSVGVLPKLRAATSSLEVLPADRAGDGSDSVDIGGLKPLSRPVRETARALPSGNPLWAVPLSALTATQARPIFSASRRPPQRAVVTPTAEPAVRPSPAPAQPERPALALIGAVVGDGDAIAVFLDRATQKIVRLRQGDSHAGWQLSAIQGREVTFKKAGRSDEVVAMQRPEGPATVAGGPAIPPHLPQPVAGALDGSYAPFTPRSTPKNGAPDGL
jgi:general secretion pathway protein N